MKALRIILMVLLPVLVLVGGVIGAKTLIESRVEPEREEAVIEPPLVRVVEAQPETVRLSVRAEGVVAPRTQSQLVPEVSGRVIEVSPSLAAGGFFDKDEVLIRIDRREYELAVVRARAAVAQAKRQLATERQEAEVARKEWAELGEGEPSPLVVREPQLAEARATLASAEAALEQAEYDLERTVVKAPYAGRVRSKSVDVGQFVQRGAAVATIYSTDIAEVRLPIPNNELAYVDLPLAYRNQDRGETSGPPVTIRADFAGRTYEWRGRINRTEAEIDPQTRAVQAVAQIQDPYAKTGGRPPLAVGMFVEAEIQGRAVRAFSLPRNALRGGDTVLIVTPEDRIELRPVDVFRAEADRLLIRDGIEAGERVCVSNLEAAVDGMKVRTVRNDPAKTD